MEIRPISTTPTTSVVSAAGAGAITGPVGAGTDFGRVMTDFVERLAQTERSTGDLVARAAAGDDVDIHDVMIGLQAESLTFQVGLQVRNKLVEAYQEIFRMQV